MATNASPIDSMPSQPSGGGVMFEDRATERLSAALNADTEPSQAEPEPVAEPEPEPLSAEAGTSEDPAVATAAADAEPQAEPDPYADEDDADPKAIEEFLKQPRGREIYRGYQFVKELEKPASEGGIGHAPSVQDVKEYFTSHTAGVKMYADFHSGDPARVGKFLSHWLGPDQNGRLSPGAQTALMNLEPTLMQFGEQAYGAVAAPVINRYEKALIEKYKAEREPGMRTAIYNAAQLIHFDMTEEWLPKELFTGAAAPAANGNGAAPQINQERQQIQSEWQKLNAAQQAIRRQADNRWLAQRAEIENSVLGEEIDKALKPLAQMKTQTPEIYESVKARYAAQVQQAAAADPEVWAIYQARVDDARRTGNMEDLKKFSRNLITPLVARQRASLLKGAGVVIKQNAADRTAQLRRIASNTAPSNTGSPVRRSVVPASAKRPGESRDDYDLRRMREALLA